MIYVFDPQIYPIRLYIATKGSMNELNDKFKDLQLKKENEDFYNALTLTSYETGNVIIWFIDKMTYTTMVHESTHAAHRILDYIGSETGIANTEQLAYLTEWVFKCCDEVKKNKIITGKIYKNENKKAKRKSKDS